MGGWEWLLGGQVHSYVGGGGNGWVMQWSYGSHSVVIR
jgi:hypothetical protein